MPHVTKLPSYVKDTLDLLKILDGLTIPSDALLVTSVVEALYASIPHDLGLQTIKTFLMEKDHRQWDFRTFVLRLLSYILKHNWLAFLRSHYLQVQGVAVPRHMPIYTWGVGAQYLFK